MNRNNETGSALIITLSLLLVVALITAAVVTISKIMAKRTKIECDRILMSYPAESAASRAVWFLLADRNNYTDRNIANIDFAEQKNTRYVADGSSHKIKSEKYYIEFSINDMISGIDVSGRDPAAQLYTFMNITDENTAEREKLTALIDKIRDYCDPDDFIRLKGMESVDYENLNLFPLPRNDQIQFKEELLWVPGISEIISTDKNNRLSIFNPISPSGIPRVTSKPGFFNASKKLIMTKCSMSPEEADMVIKARDAWNKDRIPLSDNLEPDITGKINSAFSFSESGAYTITVKASETKNSPARTLIISLKISNTIQEGGLKYYEYLLF